MIKLSIIIVNFNTYSFLAKCLQSIRKGTLSQNKVEVFVVDNHSTDGSVSLIRKNFPYVRLFANTENKGFARANNQAVQRAKGEYVLLLNPDTVLLPDTLSKMLSYMDENKNCAVATCRIELPSGELDDACHRGFPTPWNAFCHFSGIASVFKSSTFFNGYHLGYKKLNQIHEIDSCVGAFLLVRKKIGDEIGWLDPEYFWYGEDLDFCYRVKEKGEKVMFVPITKIIHHKGVASGIKKHSKHLSLASPDTIHKATKARFEVMKIFYRKHYRSVYPSWLTALVLLGITLLENVYSSRIRNK